MLLATPLSELERDIELQRRSLPCYHCILTKHDKLARFTGIQVNPHSVDAVVELWDQ